jgi:hypothetical protein
VLGDQAVLGLDIRELCHRSKTKGIQCLLVVKQC